MTETVTQPQVEAQPPAQKPQVPKIRSITVDTLTAIQKFEIIEGWGEGKNFDRSKWRDLGVDLVLFAKRLTEMGFLTVGIIGPPGSGKSYGMKALKPGTNIWYNCDDKESTYKGGRQEYGTRQQPTYLHKRPTSYDEILGHISVVQNKSLLDSNPVAFLVGHTEEFKAPGPNGTEVVRQRLKTMGNIARASLEDMLTMCYYSEVVPGAAKPSYKLRTQNTGFNTGRTLEGQHDQLLIDNNFQTIIDSYDNY